MILPTVTLWVSWLAMALVNAFEARGANPNIVDYVGAVLGPLVLVNWVCADASIRGQKFCYDFDSFLFFAWPVLGPLYLFRTRGWRALLTLLWFGLLLVSSALISALPIASKSP